MYVYLSMIFFSVLFAWLGDHDTKLVVALKNNNKISIMNKFFIISMLIPTIVAGVRWNVGTDYSLYRIKQIPFVLNELHRFGYKDIVEPLYRYLIRFSMYIGNEQTVFIITHILIIFFCYLGIYKNSKNITLSVFLVFATGFYFFSLNIMRQSISISIFLYAIKYIYEKKPNKFIAWIIIAFLFHKTAILYLIAYPLQYIKLNRKICLFTLPIFLVLYPYIRILIEFFVKFIPGYDHYFGSQYDYSIVDTSLIALNYIILVVISKSKLTGRKFNLYFNMQVTATIVAILSGIIPNYSRIVYLFLSVLIISVPNVFVENRLKERRMLIIGIIVLLSVYSVNKFFINNSGDIFPYQTIFNN
ncbi:hypothetical protein IGI69_001118 [Enterococcus sp. DIV1083b]|uniref:EpsG family protein n=1 Tax=Enterococcus TaxID=1350 RepID=UPI003D6B32E4